MPGVFRPYTLVDVLGTLNDQSSAAQGSVISSQGFFSATNENFTLHDTVTTIVQSNRLWDQGTWGSVTWS